MASRTAERCGFFQWQLSRERLTRAREAGTTVTTRRLQAGGGTPGRSAARSAPQNVS
jgi:hypothetical protein